MGGSFSIPNINSSSTATSSTAIPPTNKTMSNEIGNEIFDSLEEVVKFLFERYPRQKKTTYVALACGLFVRFLYQSEEARIMFDQTLNSFAVSFPVWNPVPSQEEALLCLKDLNCVLQIPDFRVDSETGNTFVVFFVFNNTNFFIH